ncbi:zinc finger, CCHC-type containing protein [Tanacetum coccineum]
MLCYYYDQHDIERFGKGGSLWVYSVCATGMLRMLFMNIGVILGFGERRKSLGNQLEVLLQHGFEYHLQVSNCVSCRGLWSWRMLLYLNYYNGSALEAVRSGRYLTPRDITSEGFNIKSCVADLVANEEAAWEALRPRGVEVFWYRVVWFSHCTPRHAFHLWLVQLDSHAHLFFECPCSSKVWQLVRPVAGLIMPDSNQTDYKATKQYLPKIHRTHRMLRELRDEYITLEERIFHEGRYVEPSFTEAHKMLLLFRAIGLESFLTLDEQICPRFVTEFYHSFVLKKDPIDKDLSVEFKLGAFTFELTITELLRIFKTLDRGPKTFDEAMKSQDVAFWKEAINDEMDSIMGNNTWVLADLPLVYRPLGCKWIFKRKLKVDGIVKKFKARLVIQGFKQKSGIDYFDTYAIMARISIIRLLIAMTSIRNLIIHQMDVKTAFLNGELDEEVYMNQTQGFIIPVNENKVCKLIKSLYGLKQAPKQ